MDSALFPVITVTFVSFPQMFSPILPNMICAMFVYGVVENF